MGGWAINGRVRINLPFGATLTQLAEAPPGAVRSLADPYEDRARNPRRGWWIALAGLVFLAVVVGLIQWQKIRQGRYFWERPVAGAEARP
jgi:ferric-dicitrate binding protein FerR (iron transport regulator)